MAITCGVTVGLNNLKSELDNKLNAILNIDLGTPAGLAEIQASIEGTISDIASKVAEVVVIPPALKSLRGELAELAALPFAGLAAAAKIVSIAADYAGITNVSGFANLNLTDLAKSVFSISGTFDPCSATIPNITLDPSGIIQKLPAIQPPFGSTLLGAKVFAPDRQIVDNLGEAIKNNIPIVSSSLESGASTLVANATPIVADAKKEIEATKQAIESNVSTAITGMGDMVKKLPSGEPVVETKSSFVERVKLNNLAIMDEDTVTVPSTVQPKAVFVPSPDFYIAANGSKVFYKKILRYDRDARSAALQKFKADNPTLTRRQYMVAFRTAVDNGEITIPTVVAFPNFAETEFNKQ